MLILVFCGCSISDLLLQVFKARFIAVSNYNQRCIVSDELNDGDNFSFRTRKYKTDQNTKILKNPMFLSIGGAYTASSCYIISYYIILYYDYIILFTLHYKKFRLHRKMKFT